METLSIYTDIVIPLVVTMLGGFFGVIAGLIVASRSETFRKLASWEPYARNLWDRQVAICTEVLSVANHAMNSATYCFDVFNPNESSQKVFASKLGGYLGDLYDLKGQRLAICTPNFNQAVESFSQQLVVILEQHSRGKLNQELAGNLLHLWVALVDDARSEIRVERLDAEARAALEQASKAPTYDPTGNTTLPY